jgi:hypothetical protein
VLQLPYFLSHLTMLEAWMLESSPGNGTLSQLLETFVSSTFPYIVSLNRTVVCWEDFLLDDNTLHFFHLIIPSYNHGTAVQTAQNWLFLLFTDLLRHPRSFITWIVGVVVLLGMTATMIHHHQAVTVAVVDRGVDLSKHGKPYITMT